VRESDGGIGEVDIDRAGRAVELAQFGSEVAFDFPASAPGAEVQTYDPEVPKISRESLVSLGGEMLEMLKTRRRPRASTRRCRRAASCRSRGSACRSSMKSSLA
jgi:hypothetical protein